MSKDLKSPWQSVYYAFQERSEATERETRDLFFSLCFLVSLRIYYIPWVFFLSLDKRLTCISLWRSCFVLWWWCKCMRCLWWNQQLINRIYTYIPQPLYYLCLASTMATHPYSEFSHYTTSYRCSIGLRSGGYGVNLRWFDLRHIKCYPAESSHQKMGHIVVVKGWTWWATILWYTVVFKRSLLGTKGP